MKTIEMLEIFEAALEAEYGVARTDARDGADRSLSFCGICSRYGLDEYELDRYLRDTIGFGGPEVTNSYKFNLPALFL